MLDIKFAFFLVRTRVAADDGGEAEVVPSLPLSSQFITSDWHSVHALNQRSLYLLLNHINQYKSPQTSVVVDKSSDHVASRGERRQI